MIMFPPCKINLGLFVLGKRMDGYHELESIMYQIPFCDILEIVPSEKFEFSASGIPIIGDSANNLCVKAYHLLKTKFQLTPVKIHLHKIIPMGAGLGGGSSDGTYTLLMLNELFNLHLSKDELREFALELGSDCPLFVENKAQLAKGRGEVLSSVELDLRGYYVQLINIGIHVSTAQAFSNVNFTEKSPELDKLIQEPIEKWKIVLKNDFETAIFKSYPELAEIKEKLYEKGALYASMSGSGSTIIGIFKEKPVSYFEQKGKNQLELTTFLK